MTDERKDDDHWWVALTLPEGGGTSTVTTFHEHMKPGTLIVGTDGHPRCPAKVGEHRATMAIALRGTDRERISRLCTELAAGGRLKGPLTEQP